MDKFQAGWQTGLADTLQTALTNTQNLRNSLRHLHHRPTRAQIMHRIMHKNDLRKTAQTAAGCHGGGQRHRYVRKRLHLEEPIHREPTAKSFEPSPAVPLRCQSSCWGLSSRANNFKPSPAKVAAWVCRSVSCRPPARVSSLPPPEVLTTEATT